MILNANTHGYELSVPLEAFVITPIQVCGLSMQLKLLMHTRDSLFKRIHSTVACGSSSICSQYFEVMIWYRMWGKQTCQRFSIVFWELYTIYVTAEITSSSSFWYASCQFCRWTTMSFPSRTSYSMLYNHCEDSLVCIQLVVYFVCTNMVQYDLHSTMICLLQCLYLFQAFLEGTRRPGCGIVKA